MVDSAFDFNDTSGLQPLKVDGLRQMDRTMRSLPPKLGKRVLMGGLRAGGRVIVDEAKKLAPVLSTPTPSRKPGTVRNAIQQRTSKQDRYGVYIGVRKLKQKQIDQFKKDTGRAGRENPDDPYYWWQLEFGNRKMRARPFLRPAFHSKSGQALARFRTYVYRRLQREARKIAIESGWR